MARNSGSSTRHARVVADHLELVGARETVALPHDLDGRDRAALELEREREHVVDLAVGRRSAPASGTFAPVAETRTAGPAMA